MPKKIPKSVEARTQPCLTPPRISNGSEELPLNCTVPFVSVWKDSIMLCSLGGQPTVGRILNRPSLLTRSNAFVRLMKATYKGICCSLHFSCSCRREKSSLLHIYPASYTSFYQTLSSPLTLSRCTLHSVYCNSYSISPPIFAMVDYFAAISDVPGLAPLPLCLLHA